MPKTDPKERRRKLWDLYKKVMKASEMGASYQGISQRILQETADWEKPVPGVQSLLNELGVDDLAGADPEEQVRGGAAVALQGTTLGFGDEIAGGISALGALRKGGETPSEAYARGTQAQRDRIERFRAEQSPVLSGGLELAGGLVPGALTAGAAFARATAHPHLVRRAMGAAGRMAGLGAVEGGVYGVGTGEGGLQDRAAGGLVGSALGAVGGGLLGAAGVPVGAVTRRMTSAVPAVRDAAVDRATRNAIGGMLEDTGRTPQALVAAQRTLPQTQTSFPSLAAADKVLGDYARATKNLAQSLRREGGMADRITDDQLVHSGLRIIDATRRNTRLVPVADPDAALKVATDAWRRKFLRPLLASKGDTPVGSTRIRALLANFPEIKQFWRGNAEKVSQTSRYKFREAWDTLQTMSDKIGSKMPSNEKEDLIAATSALRKMLVEEIPEFGESQQVYSGIMRRFDAYKAGQKLTNADGRTIRNAVNALGDDSGAKIAMRQGLADKLETVLQDYTGGRGGVGGRLVRGGPFARERLRPLFDSDEAFERWGQSLQGERRYQRLANALGGNSTTPQQLSDQAKLEAVVTRGPSLLNEIISIVVEDPKLQRQMAEKLGTLLLETGPEEALDMLMSATRRPSLAAQMTAPPTLGAATTGLLGAAAGRESRGRSLLEQ